MHLGTHRSKQDARTRIGQKVRSLRVARQWTQAELAQRLALSQNRLSELERGRGSFTAEQFLEILRLFRVGVDAFDFNPEPSVSLGSALARFGAGHLQVPGDALLSSEHATPADALLAVLIEPTAARLVTALSPVLIWNIDAIALLKVQHDLERVGRPWRLPWLMDNTFEAARTLGALEDRVWRQRKSRALVVIDSFLSYISRPTDVPPDPFDAGLRSSAGERAVSIQRSKVSQRWRIISALQVDDFAQALRDASRLRAMHPPGSPPRG